MFCLIRILGEASKDVVVIYMFTTATCCGRHPGIYFACVLSYKDILNEASKDQVIQCTLPLVVCMIAIDYEYHFA